MVPTDEDPTPGPMHWEPHVTDDDRNDEPVPPKTGAGDAVPEADQDEKEPEAPGGPPEMDDSAPVKPTPEPRP